MATKMKKGAGASPPHGNRAEDPESARLAEVRDHIFGWRRWGPYLSERSWGTVREDYSQGRRCLEVPQLRAGTRQGLSLGRGRDRRDLRPLPAPVLRAGVLERQGPAPQGAPVRRDRVGGQSRRGRQGILLPFGQHADPLLHALPLQVPAAGISVSPADRGEPAARRPGPRVRAARHRDLRSGPLLGHHDRIRQGRARRPVHPDRGGESRPRGRPAARSATPVVPQHLVVGRQARAGAEDRDRWRRRGRGLARRRRWRPAVGPEHPGALSARTALAAWPRGRGRPAHRQRDQRRARLRFRPQVAQADHQGRLPSSALRGRSGRARPRARHQGLSPLPAEGAGGRRERAAPALHRPERARSPRRSRRDRGAAPGGGGPVLRPHRAAARDRGRAAHPAPGACRPPVDQAELHLRRRQVARRRQPGLAPARGRAGTAATRTGATSTRAA